MLFLVKGRTLFKKTKLFNICRGPGQFLPYASQDWIRHNFPCSAFASHLQNIAMLSVKTAPLQ